MKSGLITSFPNVKYVDFDRFGLTQLTLRFSMEGNDGVQQNHVLVAHRRSLVTKPFSFGLPKNAKEPEI